MAELWVFDDSETPEADGSEDWEVEDSETGQTPSNVRKGRKAGKRALQQAALGDDGDADDHAQQQQTLDSDEDDVFARLLTAVVPQPARKKQKQTQSSPDVVVLSDGDVAAHLSRPDVTHSNNTVSTRSNADTSVLGKRGQQSAEQLRLIKQQLQQVQQARQEQEEDEQHDICSPSPSPIRDIEEEAAGLFPDFADNDSQAAAAEAAQNIVATDGDGEKLQLKFKTQGHSDVTVRVKVDEPLQAALNKFRQYVADQGWGAVAKFLSPDGDKLTGQETVEGLDLEADDIIEVYLQ